jgi:hypothetical protein
MMFVTKKHLPRRTFLRGIGVTLALPLVDAMVPALTAQAPATRPVRRFAATYLPHGNLLSQWTPATAGAGYEMTPILSPLARFRDQMVVVSGTSGGPTVLNGGHAVAPASYLTGNVQPKQTEGSDILNSITVDQVIARAIGQDTLFPSLEIATEDFSTLIGACDTGYSCTYMNTISWAGPTSPNPMETNPRAVFERMFGGSGTPAQRMARMQTDRSILDSITGASQRFQSGLGRADRTRIAEYLEHVREIERRIEKAEKQAVTQPTDLTAPIGPPEAYDDHVSVMFDLMALAFQADVTRVFTFMMMRDVSSRSFPQIGVPDPHHALSHEANGRGDDPNQKVKFARVNAHHASLFASFVDKLKATPEGNGTILDNSMILYGSCMGNANDHTHNPLPLVVVGGGAGQMTKLGHHIATPDQTPTADLMLSLAQKAGAQIDSFGTSRTPLDV